ncbi:MAG: zf-HC2 domain-containing protein [Acidobacteriota bacterium]|nr:zf-HC2 domain-containing protein [Acidobacteriota bacterium]
MTRPSARCRSLLLELSRYLDGDLAPARRRTIERHIDNCTCCGTMAERLRTTLAACRAASETRLPRAVRSRAAARIRALLRP